MQDQQVAIAHTTAPRISVPDESVSGVLAQRMPAKRVSAPDVFGSKIKEIIQKANPDLNIGVCITSPENVLFTPYAKRATHLFMPASVTKLFTAAAALYLLGADYTLKTIMVTDGIQAKDVLLGNLYICGAGDPSFTQKDLENMFLEVKKMGVNKIAGNVYIDFSAFSEGLTEYFCCGACIDDVGKAWCPPVSPFIIDSNVIIVNDKKGSVQDPHAHVYKIITEVLAKQAISYLTLSEVSGVPLNARVMCLHESKSLRELVAHMLKVSDNLYANALFKILGAKSFGGQGTCEKGKQALKNFLQTYVGIMPNEIVLEDGAGLSRYNLVTPAQTVKLLTWIYEQPDLFDVFEKCLPACGVDGTLERRMIDHRGLVKAKTGSLYGCSALSGYIRAPGQPVIIFSIFINNYIYSKKSYKTAIEDEICAYIISLQ